MSQDPFQDAGAFPVSTMLTPQERARVDAAGGGFYAALHRDSVTEVVRDVRTRRAGAVLLSVVRCGGVAQAGVAAFVREFPQVPTVALVTDAASATPQAMLSLGSTGIRQIVDARDASGWRELRRYLLTSQAHEIQRRALSQLSLDLSGASEDCVRFFEALFLVPSRISTIRKLSRHLNVLPSTLMSRFFRAQLPTPKRYLAMARLVRAAAIFENPGFSIANVSNHMDYSSPQSFGRHVRALLGLTASEFREHYDGDGMLEHFRSALIAPYRDRLRCLRPLCLAPAITPPKRKWPASTPDCPIDNSGV